MTAHPSPWMRQLQLLSVLQGHGAGERAGAAAPLHAEHPAGAAALGQAGRARAPARLHLEHRAGGSQARHRSLNRLASAVLCRMHAQTRPHAPLHICVTGCMLRSSCVLLVLSQYAGAAAGLVLHCTLMCCLLCRRSQCVLSTGCAALQGRRSRARRSSGAARSTSRRPMRSGAAPAGRDATRAMRTASKCCFLGCGLLVMTRMMRRGWRQPRKRRRSCSLPSMQTALRLCGGCRGQKVAFDHG